MKENIVFIGFMGTGKTTVGREVANKLNMEFIDIDEKIEQTQNMSIPQIFEQKGEEYFRCIESRIVKNESMKKNKVISTGGGVVLNPENIMHLRENGVIIHLKADIDTILKNTSKNTNRPLLKHSNPQAKILEILSRRKELYRNHDYEIDVSLLSIEQVVSAVLNIYYEQKAK